MSALSDLLNRHIEEKLPKLSNRQIAKAAGISRGTVDNYRAGKIPDAPKEEVLQAFHDLLGIPLAELRVAAGVPRGEPEPYTAPAEFNRLSHPQRAALDEFVRSFVGPLGDSNAMETTSPPGTQAQEPKGEKTNVIRPRHWDDSPKPPNVEDAQAASKGFKQSDEDEIDGDTSGNEDEEPPEEDAPQ